ncbi:MAG: 50S ribosomal protein L20 [Candidatus Nealsonbacteria bacterium]|nr:50S ribosomal protein L20 [Candidatus Nealsonbacteria bacterium]
MVRIKRGKAAKKHKKHLLKHAKGFRWGRKSKFKLAKDALAHAWEYAYRDRKAKKREKRQLWQVKINAASRANGVSYSRLIHALKQNNIELDRKILAELAENHPDIFKKIMEKISQ